MWNYAELSKLASNNGGPAQLCNKLVEIGINIGKKDSLKLVAGTLIVGGVVGVGVTLGVQKQAPNHYLTHKPDLTVSYDSHFIKDNHQGIISRELWDMAQD